MAPRSSAADAGAAWRALKAGALGDEGAAGWRTIPVLEAAAWQMHAGVHFPGGEEAVLVGIRAAPGGATPPLPRGAGFGVERVAELERAGAAMWLALTRAPAASLELFEAMVEDVSGLLMRSETAPAERLLHLFLGRIRSWQDFMSKSHAGLLSAEAELGLVGELAMLRMLIEVGLSPAHVVAAWEGPLDGLHDLQLGHGAMEVKATLSGSGFPATISSLEQLDTALVTPIFLAGLRFSLGAGGGTLPDRVWELRTLAGAARPALDMRLLRAGYMDEDAEDYVRSFAGAGVRIIPVDETLPRLMRSSLPAAIRAARYELDLDLVATPAIPLVAALQQLGFDA